MAVAKENKVVHGDDLTMIGQLIKEKFVQKETGKGLSSNDFTTQEKNKLAGITAGAKPNVNADWDAESGDAQILHKPNIPSKVSDLDNDSHFITIEDVPEGAAASSTSPQMDGTAAVGTETSFARGDHRHPSDTKKQDVISDLAAIRSGASAGSTAYQKPGTGIPSTDMSEAVRTSLGKADSALQEHQDISGLAPKASPAFSGTPTAPTAAAGTNTTQIANTAFVKAAVDAAVSSVLKYKGTKATYADLPSTGNQTGDTWNVTAAYGDVPAGTNWAWNGTTWDALGGDVDLSNYVTEDELEALTSAEVTALLNL